MDKFDAAMAELMDCLKAQGAEIAALRARMQLNEAQVDMLEQLVLALITTHPAPETVQQTFSTIAAMGETHALFDTRPDAELGALQTARTLLAERVQHVVHAAQLLGGPGAAQPSKPRSDPSTP